MTHLLLNECLYWAFVTVFIIGFIEIYIYAFLLPDDEEDIEEDDHTESDQSLNHKHI